MSWVSLCETDELTEGAGKYVEIDGFRLGVYCHQGAYYVMDDECPHAGASLSGGCIDESGCTVCPLHGWRFALRTGEMPDAPGVAVRTYPVRLYEREGRAALVQADLPKY